MSTDRPLIVAVTLGTRGDVAPFCAAGMHLVAHGYRFRLVAPTTGQRLAERCGLEFAALNADNAGDALQDDSVARLAGAGVLGTLRNIPRMRGMAQRHVGRLMARTAEAASDADLVLWHWFLPFAAWVAEARGKPALMVAPQPVAATPLHPLPVVPAASLGGPLNRASYHLPRLPSLLLRGAFNDFRNGLGLPPLGRFAHPFPPGTPAFLACSPALLPPGMSLPEGTEAGGALPLHLGKDWTPGDDLQRFLDAGPPPVYLGFGSLPYVPRHARSALAEGLAHWGGRAILFKGGAKLKLPQGERLFLTGPQPHEKLFPMTAGVVHHGGAGTLHMGLSAGRPTFNTPIVFDRQFWGVRAR